MAADARVGFENPGGDCEGCASGSAPCAVLCQVCVAGRAAQQDRLSRSQLPEARQGRPLCGRRAQVSDDLLSLSDVVDGAYERSDPSHGFRDVRLRSRARGRDGRRSKHLTMENALDSVVAYTCANEGTIREYQRRTTQWDMGKNFDQSGSLAPWGGSG